jgi:hypothetical protein
MSRCIGFAAAAAFVLGAGTASAQAIPAADVKIQSISAVVDAEGFKCTVSVHNDNDDDARKVKLVVLFPLEVQFVSSTRNCSVGPGFPAQGYARCGLGTMAVGQVKAITITTTAPPRNRTCSAFVSNDVPDPNPTNNFGQATAPADIVP